MQGRKTPTQERGLSRAILVVGAGLIGRRHVDAIERSEAAHVSALADPSGAAAAFAREKGYACAPSLADGLSLRPDGVVLATPNAAHETGALECIAAGVPVLIEKPVATNVAATRRIAAAVSASGVPALVGHHRRHNPLIAAAKGRIEAGDLGRILAVHAQCWFLKPDDYFDVAWRRKPGAGPVLVNLIHDIDLLQHLCGPIVGVRAYRSSVARGFANEDTAVAVIRFGSGALGTLSVSDAVVSPWSWEMTAGENPAYPRTLEGCYRIAGSAGALDLPSGALWSHPGEASWMAPITRSLAPTPQGDPLVRQIDHFAAVIRGEVDPLVSVHDGLRALAVVEAMATSAASDTEVTL